jgi:S1-C subfamily serine protease
MNPGATFTNIKDSVFFIFRSDFISMEEGSDLLSQSSGTGTTIRSGENFSDILTAGHVCIDYFLSFSDIGYSYEILDFYGNERPGELIALDEESDLCLIRIYSESPAIPITNAEIISGASVRYSGYPMGLYMPGNLHHFSGYYSGSDLVGFSMFSLAVTGGSSGSAILNDDGEIVGVISSVTESFAHLVIGPGIERIKTFIFLSSSCQKYCVDK